MLNTLLTFSFVIIYKHKLTCLCIYTPLSAASHTLSLNFTPLQIRYTQKHTHLMHTIYSNILCKQVISLFEQHWRISFFDKLSICRREISRFLTFLQLLQEGQVQNMIGFLIGLLVSGTTGTWDYLGVCVCVCVSMFHGVCVRERCSCICPLLYSLRHCEDGMCSL